MDPENRDLQERLHRMNQERMQRFEDEQRAMRQILTEIHANTKDLPELVKRVDDLEGSRDRQKGAMWILGIVWGGIEAAAHFLFRHS